MVPLTMPGPPSKPVIELPGDRPTSPLTIVGPGFVTVLAPSTPYEAAVPRLTGPTRTVAEDAGLERQSGAAKTRQRGRATWRARECQNTENPGVVRTIKKKKQMN